MFEATRPISTRPRPDTTTPDAMRLRPDTTRPRPDTTRPDAMRPRPDTTRPRPNNLAWKPHRPQGLNIAGGGCHSLGVRIVYL